MLHLALQMELLLSSIKHRSFHKPESAPADGARSAYLTAGALFPFAFPLLRVLVKLFPDDAIRRARSSPEPLASHGLAVFL